ncbi:MAG: alpha/beta hydrolase [Chloroflexota bacterium]|nr:alpha/beta hydrolase [Dehalococcoidia bacterium]MDW8255098.1 alpha/beta hydrolase [Chloroflexota bacterium]
MRRGYTTTSHGQLHFREAGTGEPLVLLHHSTRSSDVWREIAPCLAARFRVLALDTPGFGSSPPPAAPPGLAGYTQAFLEALDSLGVDRFALFGFLTGAALALELAARAPSRVTKLILGACPVIDDREAWLRSARITPLQPDGSHLTAIWTNYAAGAYRGWGTLEQMQRATIDSAAAGPVHAHFAHLAVAELDVKARIPLVAAPTLLVYGTRGPFAERQAEIAPLFRAAERVAIESGPLIMQERPDVLCRIVTDFLSR